MSFTITFLMSVLLSALAFLFLLSLLIFIHELGHFLAARAFGVEVEEFGFGLPPRAKKLFKQKKTIFSLNWIPLGGFVRLKGENALGHAERSAPGSFMSASVPARIIILTAGVFMNFMLALILLTIGFSAGKWVPHYLTLEEMQEAADKGIIEMKVGVMIGEVVPGSPAAEAGIAPRSILSKIDGVEVKSPEEVEQIQKGKRSVVYTLLTGEAFKTSSEVTVNLEEGLAGVGLLSFPVEVTAPGQNVFKSIQLAFHESWVMTTQTIVGIGQLFTSLAFKATVPEGITSIIGIAQLTHVYVQQGFMTYLRLISLLSLSLAILNILPFPALDGGRLLFVFAEVISRRPLNRKFEVATNAIGFGFLLFLILLITFFDIARLF